MQDHSEGSIWVKRNRLIWYTIGLLSFPLLAGIGLALTVSLWLPWLGSALIEPSRLSSADAIVLLGGGGYDRASEAIGLFKLGYAPELWITGAQPELSLGPFSDSDDSVRLAQDWGVPSASIKVLRTTSTWSDGAEIARVSRELGTRRIIVVTDWYHSHRAMWVIRKHLLGTGTSSICYSINTRRFGPGDWWKHEDGLVCVFSETVKMGLYFVKYCGRGTQGEKRTEH